MRTPGWPTGGCPHTSGEGLGSSSASSDGSSLATPLLPTGLKGCPLGVAPGTPCPRVGAGQAQCRLRSHGASQAARGRFLDPQPACSRALLFHPLGQRPWSPHQLLGDDGGGGRWVAPGSWGPMGPACPSPCGFRVPEMTAIPSSCSSQEAQRRPPPLLGAGSLLRGRKHGTEEPLPGPGRNRELRVQVRAR